MEQNSAEVFVDFGVERVNYASLNSDSSILCMATTAGVRLVRFPDPIPVFYHGLSKKWKVFLTYIFAQIAEDRLLWRAS